MHRLYGNTIPFYIRNMRIRGWLYPQGVLEPIPKEYQGKTGYICKASSTLKTWNNAFLFCSLLVTFFLWYILYTGKYLYCTSGQDGGVGKHGSPPHTTTSKLQLNYKTAITQNHQKASWRKSNKYRIKEETTYIQTRKRNKDAEQAGSKRMCGG